MLRAHIVDVSFEPGDSITVYKEADAASWEDEGFILVRGPRFDGDCYVLHRPSRVMVKWIYQNREVSDDKKYAIKSAYAKKGKPIKNFTAATFKRFKEDLDAGKITPYFSKFKYGDIFFMLK